MRYRLQILTYIFIVILMLSPKIVWCLDNPDKASGIAFVRINEPKEQAFSILVPKGWQTEGGIFRVNPLQVGGPLNSIEAKCDLKYSSNSKGTISFRIFPDIVYAHAGIGGGYFPVGSNYQGAEVRPLVDASTYLTNMFSSLHPTVNAVKTLKIKRLPGEIQALDRSLAYTNQLFAQIGLQSLSYKSDAAGGLFEYIENGIRYHEIIMTGIINMPAALTWKNTRTLAFRAPADQFEQWRPVMDIMRFSVRFNPQWIIKECEGQRERANIVLKVYDEIRRIDQEIIKRTTINREEIMNDNFLVLTEQEEFVNPHTGQVEVDTDAYKFRWITPGGDIYYTNRDDENPNTFLQRGDYKRSLVRKRRNE